MKKKIYTLFTLLLAAVVGVIAQTHVGATDASRFEGKALKKLSQTELKVAPQKATANAKQKQKAKALLPQSKVAGQKADKAELLKQDKAAATRAKVHEQAKAKAKTTSKLNLKHQSKKYASQRNRIANASKAQTSANRAAATIDDNGIITEAPEGEHRYYKRSGYQYYYNGYYVTGDYQYGATEIVFTDDDEVYIKNVISSYPVGTWVKGTINGNIITVAADQPVAYSDNYHTTLSVAWISYDDESGFSHRLADEDDITFAIDDEKKTISLEGSDEDHFIAVVWDDDNTFSGYGDFETVLTYAENYDPTHGLITEAPEGEHKLYGRTGSYVSVDYEYNIETEDYEYYIATGSQAQAQETVEVVFAADDKVYVKDIISIYGNDTWVEGTIQGNTITIAANQPIDFSERFDTTLSVVWATYDANSEKDIYHSWTRSNDDITFTIDDENGTVTLVGSDENKVVAVLYDDDDYFVGGDYETVWDANYDPTHGIISEVPEGEVKIYNRHGYTLSSIGTLDGQGGSVELITTADGTVYIKNFVYASYWDNNTYVKGKRSGNTIIIPANQPIDYNSWFGTTLSVVWATYDTDSEKGYAYRWTRNNDDIVFNVDDENGTITLVGSDENKVVAVLWDDDNNFTGGDYETVWTDDYDPTHGIITEAPEGEHKYYNRSGDAVYYWGLYPEKQNGPVEIVFADNNEVYIKNVVYEYKNDAWVKGTINGNTITIAANQPIDFDEDYKATISIAWGSYYYYYDYYWEEEEEGYERASGDITFTIDDENGTITLVGSDQEHIVAVFWDNDDYFSGGDYNTVWTYNENYVKPTTELIELPEDAEVETYNASAYFNFSGENDELTEFEVQIAVVGNEIYISGLSEEYPDAWIKGVINEDNTVTFNGAQYIGEYEYYYYGGAGPYLLPVHVIASDYDLESLLNAFTFTYDPDKNTLSLDVDQTILLNLLSDEDIYAITRIDELVIEGIEISYKEEDLTKGGIGLSVDNINANEETNDVWYDLSGRRLENKPANRGIYIKNGEKVIVK